MNEWRVLPCKGSSVVLIDTFSWRHGLGKQRHRGFVGRIWRREGKRDVIEGCGHPHKSRAAADTCARRWAKRRNALEHEEGNHEDL